MAARNLFFGLLGSLLTLPVFAQMSVIDSLEQAYAKAKTDADRIHILKNISWEYLNNRYDRELAQQYIDSVYNMSKRTGDEHGIALANYQYAVLERQEGNYDKALGFIEPYLEFALKEDDQFAYANGLYQKAVTLDEQGEFDKSLEIYYMILRIYEEKQDDFSIGTALNAIGETLQKIGKVSEAMNNYTRALKLFNRLENKTEMANVNFNIGDTHLHLKAYDSALVYFNKALELDKEIKSQWGMAFDYESIGKVYEEQGDLNKALPYHESALELRLALGQKRELSLSYAALGSLNRKLKNYSTAQDQLLKALEISEDIGAKTESRSNYSALSLLYEEQGNYQKALEYKDKYVVIDRELYNEAKSNQLEELQVRFESEKQQAEIDALEKDAVISDLKLKRQTTFRNITIGIALAAILLSFALFNRYKYRQRIKLEAEEKKRLLDSEKRKTELEKKRVDELKKIDKLKDEFLANTSHELRTPLNGIIGLAESLKDGAGGKLTAKAKDNLNMITNSGKRLSHLINDILDFSKLKNKDLILARRPIDLYPITQVIIRLSEPLIDGKNLQLINEIDPNLPLIDADENRLQQILHNLIGNAIKFTREGTIKLTARTLDAFMEIKVSDTGIGIEEDKFETIFNSFQQGDGSTIREYGGTGLGLSVTKQLVELHGGQISVKSKVGQGSEFIFTIPLSDAKRENFTSSTETELDALNSLAAEVNTTGKESLKQSPKNKGKRILIVDDEPVNRRVLQNHLDLAGYSIEEANNGQEALHLIENSPPFDLVLLDIMMPGMSGFEVCEKIRINYLTSELPVVILTAKNRVSDLVNGFSAGANDYLTKPFSKNELLSRIKTHLNLTGIHKAASKFVPTEFIRSIGRHEITDVELGDQVEKNVTVLFSDIRTYTTLAEEMTPRQNFKFVNSFVGKMGPVIRENQGFVNQFLGDGIMALFPVNAEHALKAAIGMQKAIHKYNARRIQEGNIPIAVGIGMHTGPLVMGIIGDIHRNDTAIISDTVNTASRMEGVTKFYGAQIIISEESVKTFENKDDFGLRFLGRVKVKGKDKALGIYECYEGDENEQSIQLKKQTLKEFDKGIQLFINGEFPKATATFDKVLGKNPEDKVAKYFITKSAEFTLSGFPKDWDAVTSMEKK